ncbi:hypothetical protein SESBI_42220 [Sesbania bispinosa]|nr:hypothetical protein SESBI_42220 [Sesbania bispinosa]
MKIRVISSQTHFAHCTTASTVVAAQEIHHTSLVVNAIRNWRMLRRRRHHRHPCSCIDTTRGGGGSFTAQENDILQWVFGQRLPEPPGRFDEEVVRAAIPSDRGKVDLGGDGDFPVATCSGEKDREMVGRDPYPLTQESDEAPEIHGGVNHDSAEIDLSVTTGAYDSEGRVSTAMHHFPTTNE